MKVAVFSGAFVLGAAITAGIIWTIDRALGKPYV